MKKTKKKIWDICGSWKSFLGLIISDKISKKDSRKKKVEKKNYFLYAGQIQVLPSRGGRRILANAGQ